MKIRNEFQIGLVGLITLVVLYFGIKFLKGSDLFSSNTTYYAIYNNVAGMHESSYIYSNGLKVGFVKKITPMDKMNKRFLVEIAVDKNISIPKDSHLVFYSDGLLGSKALRIDNGTSTQMLNKKDTLQAFIESGMLDGLSGQITPVMTNLASVMRRIDTLTASLNNTFNAQSQANIQAALININFITERLNTIVKNADDMVATDKQKLNNIVANVESITNNLKNNNEEINNIISSFNSIADTIAKANVGQTLAKVNTSLETLNLQLNKIEQGKGNVGQLLNDEQLYDNITSASKNLNLLIEDIKANPKKYLSIRVF